ncbi:hypothetical protein [Nocardioides sp.]|uniref:divisome protein SepX/GlpR n=1 Tax=Nocardioides sp. TaxID=35761 RepID=UPI003517C15F
MDLSALIFVALAVAWAAYLIPKALKLHEESAASRHIDGFSDRLRVLARREAVDTRTARLVIPGRPARKIETGLESGLETGLESGIETASATAPEAAPAPATPAPRRPVSPAARRAAARRAARRRRRVLGTLILALVVVSGLAVPGILAAWAPAVPGVLIVAWLVTCRLMVRGERARDAVARPAVRDSASPAVVADADPLTDALPAVPTDDAATATGTATGTATEKEAPEAAEPAVAAQPGWDPVPVTLPTYVAKQPAAPRKVRTIDLDSTGVWSSGRSESDSALVREADQAAQAAAAAADAEERRLSGS